MDRDLQTILLRDNPWISSPESCRSWLNSHLPVNYYERDAIVDNRKRWRNRDSAHLVTGPRQAGKTTAVWAHLSTKGKPALFVDCEQWPVRNWCRSAPLFLDSLEQMLDRPVTLFFDEIQHLEEAGLFLKGLVDRKPGVSILVSGSSAFHLGSKTRESLAGRATRTTLLPFSLKEVCSVIKSSAPIAAEKETIRLMERHFIFGGYPPVWLSESPEPLLVDLVEAIVMRDASDLFRIDRPDAFRKILRLAAGQAGNLLNLSEWAALSGISRNTAASYLDILESSHIIRLLPPFTGGKRSEITRRPKVFLFDNGIRNQLIGDFNPLENRGDAGQLVENWVFGELAKYCPRDASIHFWRSTSGTEVDFVVQRGKKLMAVEVKAKKLVRPQLSRSSRSFIEAYQPVVLCVINSSLEYEMILGRTEVLFRRPFEIEEVLTCLT